MRHLVIILILLLLVLPMCGCITSGSSTIEKDTDGDGWSDVEEEIAGTNPRRIDTDGDGIIDPKDPNPLVSNNQTPTTVVSTTQAPTIPATTFAPSSLSLSVGETAFNSRLSVTIMDALVATEYDYYSEIFDRNTTATAPAGKKYVLVDVIIENKDSSSYYASYGSFSLEDSEGYAYDPYFLYYGDDEFPLLKELYQNQKVRGKVLFQVPLSSSGLKLFFDFGDLFSGPNLACWMLEN